MKTTKQDAKFFAERFSHVKVTIRMDAGSTAEDINRITVDPIWKGVDRPCTGGYGFSIKHRALAYRLKAAIESGKFYSDFAVVKDVNGKTYVQCNAYSVGRHLNSDLRKLGF